MLQGLILGLGARLESGGQEAYFWNDRATQITDPVRKEEALNRSLEANPNYFYALFNRGILMAQLNRREEALRDLRRAVEADPTDQTAREALLHAQDGHWHLFRL
jgi:tetratricopeptide (TPR) repeat protein